MATIITSDCISCGACESECPNTAIYQGGVEFELNGVKHPALAQDIFYIVPEKCTECVGFHDKEACAVACPVDCCVTDPDRPETEDVLIARTRQLHPDKVFSAPFPSRFGSGGAVAAPAAAPTGAPAAEAIPAAASTVAPKVEERPAPPSPAVAAKAAEPAPPPTSPTPGPEVSFEAAAPAPIVSLIPEKTVLSELPESFDVVLARLGNVKTSPSVGAKLWPVFAQPILGALPNSQKKRLEQYVGDPRLFTAAGATGVNAIQNMILYPLICAAVAAVWLRRDVFSAQVVNWMVIGLALAVIELAVRTRFGWRGVPMEEARYGPSLYGLALGALFEPMMRMIVSPEPRGTIVIHGFHGGTFEEKIERERRYGEVYSLHDKGGGYLFELEFPRRVPKSAAKQELGVADEMPEYEYNLAIENGFIVVHARLTDARIRKLAAVSPAFPPDFTTRVKLPAQVTGFKQRMRKADRVLEVVLPKR